MNQYSELLYYIKQLLESDDMVHTVTKGQMPEKDLEKFNIYPLCHIDISGGSFSNGQTVSFDVDIACMDIRDINNEIDDDKFWSNDNEVDNHNATLAILNRLWTSMYRDFSDKNITASENPTLNKITFEDSNLLDGWMISFQVELPNNTLNLCQE